MTLIDEGKIMEEKIIRIFECSKGHKYRSNEAIICSGGPYSKLTGKKPNDRCKICGSVIIAERDFVNGKNVMGAVRYG